MKKAAYLLGKNTALTQLGLVKLARRGPPINPLKILALLSGGGAVAGGGAGALTGALSEKGDPLRGALYGAGLGAVGAPLGLIGGGISGHYAGRGLGHLSSKLKGLKPQAAHDKKFITSVEGLTLGGPLGWAGGGLGSGVAGGRLSKSKEDKKDTEE
jgi:hypothetical protein